MSLVLRGSLGNVCGTEGKLQTCSLASCLFCDSQGSQKEEARDTVVVSRVPDPKLEVRPWKDKAAAEDTAEASKNPVMVGMGTSEGLWGH